MNTQYNDPFYAELREREHKNRLLHKQLWADSIAKLFPHGIPGIAQWRDPEEIRKILNFVGTHAGGNYRYFPPDGWDRLDGTRRLLNRDKIELTFNNTIVVVKPLELVFVHDSSSLDLAFFSLECAGLDRVNTPPESRFLHFEYLALVPSIVGQLVYFEGDRSVDSDARTRKLPENARKGVGLIEPGAFRIFGPDSDAVACFHGTTYERIVRGPLNEARAAVRQLAQRRGL